MTVLGTARSVSSSRTHCALFHETREEEVRQESPHRFLPTQSYSSVGQSATLIMWRSAVQVCLGLLLSFSGGLAQLARAPALQAGGQRFESVILHSKGNRYGLEVFPSRFLPFAFAGSLTYLHKQDCKVERFFPSGKNQDSDY